MTAQKFDWSSVGGRPADQKNISQGNNVENKSNKKAFDWSSVGGRPAEQKHINQLKSIQEQHPYLLKLAEMLQGQPGLEQAGNIAGHIANATEGTGLPSLARGFLGSGVEMGRGLTNLIPGVNIQKQQLPELNVNPYVKEGTQTIGSLGMGLPVYRGYQAAKTGLNAIPYVKKIPDLLKNIIAGGTTASALSPDNRRLAAGLGAGAEIAPAAINKIKDIFKSLNVSGREKDLLKAMFEHEVQKSEEESLKNVSKHKFGSSNPESLALKLADKEAELASSEALKRNRLDNEQMLPGNQTPPEIEHNIEAVNKILKQNLGEGEPNIQNASKNIVEKIEGIPVTIPHPKTGLPKQTRQGGLREFIGNKYDELENNLPDVNIPTADLKSVEKELNKLTSGKAALTDEEKENLRQLLISTHPSNINKTVSGKKFFRTYRSLRKKEGVERSNAYGLSPEEHDKWIERANETKKTYEDMEKIIDKHFPEDTIKRLHQINHEYSTQVAPLHENPMYQQMLRHGFYKGDPFFALSGTTKGNDILNNMIRNDPELSRLLLGHSFSENPGKLLKTNKLIEPHLQVNPHISDLLNIQKQNVHALENAKQKEMLYKYIDNLPKLKQEIKEQKSMIKRLENESEVTGLTKHEISQKKLEHEKAKKRLKQLVSLSIASPIAGTAVYHGIKRIQQ